MVLLAQGDPQVQRDEHRRDGQHDRGECRAESDPARLADDVGGHQGRDQLETVAPLVDHPHDVEGTQTFDERDDEYDDDDDDDDEEYFTVIDKYVIEKEEYTKIFSFFPYFSFSSLLFLSLLPFFFLQLDKLLLPMPLQIWANNVPHTATAFYGNTGQPKFGLPSEEA